MSPDLLLENARVVDGTGAPWFRGSVAIDDGRIRAVERVRTGGVSAHESLDLDGSVLAPGFVDLHVHSDLRLFEEPTLPAKTRQGVTTEVLGQDGFSMAPMYREGSAVEWEEHLSALNGVAGREWTGVRSPTTSMLSRSRVPPRTSGRWSATGRSGTTSSG